MVNFVAIYASSTVSQTGCVKKFATTERGLLTFPAQVQWSCDLCNVSHNFRLDRVVTVATPRARKSVRAYCEEHGLDLDVEIEAAATT